MCKFVYHSIIIWYHDCNVKILSVFIFREVQLPKLKRIWLDSTKITEIDNLEMLGNVTHLYLHNNQITSIQNLDTLCFTLQHLDLKGNLVTTIGNGLLVLEHLMSLDISSNKLGNNLLKPCISHHCTVPYIWWTIIKSFSETLDSCELPKSLRFINFLNNPVIDSPDFDEDALIDVFIELLSSISIINIHIHQEKYC